MNDAPLSAEQEAQAQAIFAKLQRPFQEEALRLARLMASKDDRHLLGDTEFQVRDRVHELGAQVLQAALDERKKRGTKDPAPPVSTAVNPHAVSTSARKRFRR